MLWATTVPMWALSRPTWTPQCLCWGRTCRHAESTLSTSVTSLQSEWECHASQGLRVSFAFCHASEWQLYVHTYLNSVSVNIGHSAYIFRQCSCFITHCWTKHKFEEQLMHFSNLSILQHFHSILCFPLVQMPSVEDNCCWTGQHDTYVWCKLHSHYSAAAYWGTAM